MDEREICAKLREPKSWSAWRDYGGHGLPPMDHDSDIPKQAADAIENLLGEASVLADILRDAYAVIKTIEGENSDEEERLWQLRYMIEMALSPYSGKKMANESNDSGIRKNLIPSSTEQR